MTKPSNMKSAAHRSIRPLGLLVETLEAKLALHYLPVVDSNPGPIDLGFEMPVRQWLTSEEIAAAEVTSRQLKQAYQEKYGALANKLDGMLAQDWEKYKAAVAADPNYVANPYMIELSVEFEKTDAVRAKLAELGYAPLFILNSAASGNEAQFEIDLGSLDEILAMDEVGAFRKHYGAVFQRAFASTSATVEVNEFTKPCSTALIAVNTLKPGAQAVDAVFAAPVAMTTAPVALPTQASNPTIGVVITDISPTASSAPMNSEHSVAAQAALYHYTDTDLGAALFSSATSKKAKSR